MTFMINTTYNLEYIEIVHCSHPRGNAGITWRIGILHQYTWKDTPFPIQMFLHTYTTIISEVMGRRKHFPLQLLHTTLMFCFTRSLLDADIVVCPAFVGVNYFFCNLDNNIFFLWPTRMPRQWGTRPIPRPRSRNIMCWPKHTHGSWWQYSDWIALMRRRDVFIAR